MWVDCGRQAMRAGEGVAQKDPRLEQTGAGVSSVGWLDPNADFRQTP
jgi:hypothetical protein